MERLCPVGDPKGFSQALATPRSEVAQTFSNLTSSIGFFGDRGGTRRSGKPVFYKELSQRLALSGQGYGAEMTFTNPQRELVMPTILMLNGLIEGKTYDINGVNPVSTPNIEEHIVSSLMEASGTLSFIDATKNRLKELIDGFARNYPNLVPALHGMFEVAGAEGFVGVLVLADRYIRAAQDGRMNEQNIPDFQAEDYERSAFVMPHQGYNSKPYGYEISCTGETTARMLLPYLKRASLRAAGLALPSNGTEPYTNSPANIDEFRKYMRDVAKQAQNGI